MSILLLLLPVFVVSTWTTPLKLLSSPTESYQVTSVYFDPASHMSHATVVSTSKNEYRHLAVSADGTKVRDTAFPGVFVTQYALLTGPKDGKQLYMALHMYEDSASRENKVAFLESGDSGQTWAKPVFVHAEGERLLNDMVYVKETGRIFVFLTLTTPEGTELRLVTRAPGSSVFGPERTVSRDLAMPMGTKVAYSLEAQGRRIFLHAFYRNTQGRLAYVRSDDFGVSWATHSIINAEEKIMSVEHAIGGDEGVFVTYSSFYQTPMRLIVTKDHGESFLPSTEITHGAEAGKYSGLALCSGRMVSMVHTVDGSAYEYELDYALVDAKSLAREGRSHPFGRMYVESAGVGCYGGAGRGLEVNVFVSDIQASSESAVYFVREYN